MKFSTKFLIVYLVSCTCTSCAEIKTTNPQKAYRYWCGEAAPEGMQLLHAQYWQSAHFTKEYTLYLHFKPGSDWWRQYLDYNHLRVDTGAWTKPSDAPDWFNPSSNCIRYGLSAFTGYFRDTITGECFIYETQL